MMTPTKPFAGIRRVHLLSLSTLVLAVAGAGTALELATAAPVPGPERFTPRELRLGGRPLWADLARDRLTLRTAAPRDLTELEVQLAAALALAAAKEPALAAVTFTSLRGLRRDGLYLVELGAPLDLPLLRSLACALASAPGVVQSYPVLKRGTGVVYYDAHLVLRAAPGQLDAALTKALPLVDAELVRRSRVPDTALLRVGPRFAFDAVEAARQLSARAAAGEIASAEPQIYRQLKLAATVDDPMYEDQWFLHRPVNGVPGEGQIHVEEAWDITKGDPEVVIAVLDTGVDIVHPDLAGNIKGGFDPSAGDDDPSAECTPSGSWGDPSAPSCPEDAPYRESHGTAVSGVAAAVGDNGVGVSGVCPRCSIMAVRLLGYEETSADLSTAEAFVRAVDDGAAILNNSWGAGYSAYFPLSSVEREALRYARYQGRGGLGSVVFFAAGNDTSNVATDAYARDVNVMAVAASTNLDDWAYYSNYGYEIDVAAPSGGGADETDSHGLLTTDFTGEEGYDESDYYPAFSGTSGASPVAAGVAGLVLSANPDLTADQVRVILMSSADKIRADKIDWETVIGADVEEIFDYDADGHSVGFGWGRVNAARAVQAALQPSIQGAACDAVGCTSCGDDGRCRLRCKSQDDCLDGTLCRDTYCVERAPSPTDVGEPCTSDCYGCLTVLDSRFEPMQICTDQCRDDEECPAGFVCRRIDEAGTRVCALGTSARATGATGSFRSCMHMLVFASVVVEGYDGARYCSEFCFSDDPGACPYGFHCGLANCECSNERNGWCREYLCHEAAIPGTDNWYTQQCFPDPEFGITCQDDDLCKVGDYCRPDHSCRLDDREGCLVCAPCEFDEDCGAGGRCRDLDGTDEGRCAIYCQADGTCPGDAVCREVEERFGTMAYCLSPDPPPEGQGCDPSYACQVPCRDDVPCAEGEVCEEGSCVPAPPPPPPPDGGDDDPIAEGETLAGGTTCSAAPAPGAAGWLLVLAVAGVLLRRRRALR